MRCSTEAFFSGNFETDQDTKRRRDFFSITFEAPGSIGGTEFRKPHTLTVALVANADKR